MLLLLSSLQLSSLFALLGAVSYLLGEAAGQVAAIFFTFFTVRELELASAPMLPEEADEAELSLEAELAANSPEIFTCCPTCDDNSELSP